ncbi:hypothetical protein BWQ96_06870 [Gracilariopsis chorda]|uniref:BTB domain-containing protein n=1 Tax=Gracilariopsis chorda TaxID=448386 RepID=A0A2V3IMR3_9FLOR|nr:hypothetical protein BWQ96_06870 [Gracilariopsis chorda]|eukprot:PXF43375.1 hypothetical protein BWQ96_06870 [Gracilariopsis chorda]
MAKRKPIALRTWQLDGSTLTPTACHLQCYENRRRPNPDPLVTLRFAAPAHASSARESPQELFIHASVLRDSSSPLRALVSSGFLESTTHVVHLDHQSFQPFKVIVSFLQCEDIDMTTVPDHLAVFADRWGLDVLFEACLAYAEIRSWSSVDEFMLFSLPLMRFLHVPYTFKCVFASRLALCLSDVQDWISGDEGIRNQRRRLAPTLNNRHSRAQYTSHETICNTIVGTSPNDILCGRPAVLSHGSAKFYCIEHLVTVVSEDSPKPAERPPSSPSSSAQVNPPDNQSPVPTQAENTDRAPHATKSFASCEPAVVAKKASTSSVSVARSSQAVARAQCQCSSSDTSKPSESKSEKRPTEQPVTEVQDAIQKQRLKSLPAFTSNTDRSTRPQQLDSEARSFEMVSIAGKKRGRNSESAEKEQALWDAMKSQHMLYKALKELAWYAMPGCVPFILDGVLRVMEDKLSESEQVALLRILPWDRRDFEQVLNSDFTSKWSTREWRIVARAQAQSARIAGGGDEYSAVFYWWGFADEVCQSSGAPFGKLRRETTMLADGLYIHLALHAREKRKLGHHPLFLTMSVLDDTSSEDLRNMPLLVSIHLRAMDCSCEAASCSKSALDYNQSYGFRHKNVKVKFLLGTPVFEILSEHGVAQWVKLHQPSCGLALRVVLRICKDQVDPEADMNDAHDVRLRRARGICPCGSCYEEGLSDDSGQGEDIYIIASDDSDHPSAGNEDDISGDGEQSDQDHDLDSENSEDDEDDEPDGVYYL